MKINVLKLLILMSEHQFNIGNLAERSGVFRQTISYIKSGKTCTPIIAGKIANALCVAVHEIVE